MSREFRPHAACLRMTLRLQAQWLPRMGDSPFLIFAFRLLNSVFVFLTISSNCQVSQISLPSGIPSQEHSQVDDAEYQLNRGSVLYRRDDALGGIARHVDGIKLLRLFYSFSDMCQVFFSVLLYLFCLRQKCIDLMIYGNISVFSLGAIVVSRRTDIQEDPICPDFLKEDEAVLLVE